MEVRSDLFAWGDHRINTLITTSWEENSIMYPYYLVFVSKQQKSRFHPKAVKFLQYLALCKCTVVKDSACATAEILTL